MGYTVAAVSGIVVGLSMGTSRYAEAIIKPLFELIRPIPPIAWIPLVILWFGVGELPKYSIIFIGSVTNITLNAYTGAQRVDPTLIGCARMFGTSDRDIFLWVIVPSSLPQIFAGMQVALSTAWMAVLAAEMVGAQEGCGWIILRGSDTTNIPLVLVGMAVIGGVVLVLDDISFEVKEGEFLCIVGPTGCGKTTFLNSLTKLYDITAGEILVNEEPVDLKRHNIA